MVSSGRSHLFRVGFDLSGSAGSGVSVSLEKDDAGDEPMALPKESLCCIDRSGAKVDSDFMAATAAVALSVD